VPSQADLDRELSSGVRTSPERRAVYADWLLERGDPRGELLTAAHSLSNGSTSTAQARSAARLAVVAALKRVATWLDDQVPEGRPWRPSDVRGVTSEPLGFLSHVDGVLHRFRIASSRDQPLPLSLAQAIPTVNEIGIPATPSTRAGSSALHLVRVIDQLGDDGAQKFDCFDIELPVSLARLGMPRVSEDGWRFAGLAEALARRTKPVELRLSDGALDVESFGALLAVERNVSMLWLDRVRLPVDGVGALVQRSGGVPHVRLVETPVDVRVAEGLRSGGAFDGISRLEVKEWPVGAPSLEAILRGALSLRHLCIIRSPLGSDLARLLSATGRLAALETLDVSGCLLGVSGVTQLLQRLSQNTRKLVVRFNQLTEDELLSLARLTPWPRHCEVSFEEVTFGAGAHQALAAIAAAHRLPLQISGCVLTLCAG
jgi:hypothetical protein